MDNDGKGGMVRRRPRVLRSGVTTTMSWANLTPLLLQRQPTKKTVVMSLNNTNTEKGKGTQVKNTRKKNGNRNNSTLEVVSRDGSKLGDDTVAATAKEAASIGGTNVGGLSRPSNRQQQQTQPRIANANADKSHGMIQQQQQTQPCIANADESRWCDQRDISTHNSNDLVIGKSLTPGEQGDGGQRQKMKEQGHPNVIQRSSTTTTTSRSDAAAAVGINGDGGEAAAAASTASSLSSSSSITDAGIPPYPQSFYRKMKNNKVGNAILYLDIPLPKKMKMQCDPSIRCHLERVSPKISDLLISNGIVRHPTSKFSMVLKPMDELKYNIVVLYCIQSTSRIKFHFGVTRTILM